MTKNSRTFIVSITSRFGDLTQTVTLDHGEKIETVAKAIAKCIMGRVVRIEQA